MEVVKKKNYMSDIHLEDYTEQYEIKHATAEIMVFDEWPTMQLPACWNTVGKEYLLYDGSMVFTIKFSYQKGAEEEVF